MFQKFGCFVFLLQREAGRPL